MLTIFLSLLFAFPAEAKRPAPKPVTPVTYKGLRYEAPHWASEHKEMKQNGGHIRVVNAKTGQQVCLKQVYATHLGKDLEQDVQDNFITGLKVQKGFLVISSEKLPHIRRKLKHFCDRVLKTAE